MIAMIVDKEAMRNHSLRSAFANAGFDFRETFTTDQADANVSSHELAGCVLIVEAGSLGTRTGSATWTSFLTAHRGLPAVVVARDEANMEARQATWAPHRALLDNPVDAAAVVAAAQHVSARQLSLV